jgi:hypothetical protein
MSVSIPVIEGLELSESRERNESFVFGWLDHRVNL